jgi:lipopolysaccharide/colanic/teichoic acid biosynthesis glycosyltransferase
MEKVSVMNSQLSRIMHRFNNNYDQQQQIDSMIKMIFIIIFALVGLILLGSVMFGIAVCIRLMLSAPLETVGKWKILNEESKV